VVAIVGPTAAGKSDLAMALADSITGEIVNADSMQLYLGMDIGTAKPTPADRSRVPHHLLDLWDVTHDVTVAEYQPLARAAIDDIRARGHLPLVVGGSGLYVRAVLDDLRFPGTDPDVRERLEAELEALGPEALHARLAVADPAAAVAILPTNGRRIVRALEVIEITGQPFTATLPDETPLYPDVRIGLEVPPAMLAERIAARVRRMWGDGFVDEVRALPGLANTRTAARAIGYAQVLAHLAGEIDEPTAIDDTVVATRRFAKRQFTWFRRDARVQWLPFDDPQLVERARDLIALGVNRS
jgi:tRNA dimethylallyltransferase